MKFELPALYAITDVGLSGISHSEQVSALCSGGATLIQLRDKEGSSDEFCSCAAEALRVGRKFGAKVLINDRVDIAMATGSDGVHLGQEDMPPEAARRLLGDRAIIGLSTHNLNQVRAAVELPIDYLAFGPIFRTSSKENPDPEVGLDLLSEVRRIAGAMQVVAIGGITPASAQMVLSAGADSIAMIRSLLKDAPAIQTRTRDLLNSLHSPQR